MQRRYLRLCLVLERPAAFGSVPVDALRAELSGSTLVQADIGGCEAPGHSGPIGYLNRQLDRDLALVACSRAM